VGTQRRLILLTGFSGAGIRAAVNCLSDLGIHCIDHLPLSMVKPLLLEMKTAPFIEKDVALGLHLYEPEEIKRLLSLLQELETQLDVDLVFLTAEVETLLSRFEANRRRHPFAAANPNLTDAIQAEIDFLQPIKRIAKLVIETTNISPSELGRILEQRYFSTSLQRTLFVSIKSFGFKHGMLKPADMIFDVRFLRNPFFTLQLRNQSGLDPGVRDFVLSDPKSIHFLQELDRLHTWLLPQYYEEGKHFLRIGIGCTGGQHRSVCIAEELGLRLRDKNLPYIRIDVSHRDRISG
jgi:UPF0042 nucleotide-binding protein